MLMTFDRNFKTMPWWTVRDMYALSLRKKSLTSPILTVHQQT